MKLKEAISMQKHKFFNKASVIFSTNKKEDRFAYLLDKDHKEYIDKNIQNKDYCQLMLNLEKAVILKYERTIRRFKI